MSLINDLSELLLRLPGIGPRQSKRFVYFLLRQNPSFLKELSDKISRLPNEIKVCTDCYRYFPSEEASPLCKICRNNSRDRTILMVVEKDVDLENVEKTGVFEGVYFVLGGTATLSEEDGGKFIRKSELLNRVNKDSNTLAEVVIATSATTEGDHTAFIIKRLLEKVANKKFKISTLGRGLSTGTELEYSDSDTLKNALEGRK
jgi:recombination protein RecR